MTQEVLKLALEALKSCDAAHITDGGHQWYDENLVDKAITAIEKALAEHAMREVQRLGQEIEQELKIKTTDPFESSRVADYNRGWNDCLFASGIVKQPDQEPVATVQCINGITIGYLEIMQPVGTKLYTTPPQRKLLTDEEIDAVMPQPTKFGIVQPPWNGLDITILRAMARAIESAHGIKENT